MENARKEHPEFEVSGDTRNKIPDETFLVLEGVKVVPLLQAIINIGRRFENDIVIDDPRVSRYHAQLRAVGGKFELHDMNSSGGTYINGMRITKSILYPNDEISLAGFTIVYRQHDAPPRSDLKDTSPLRSDE